jgi:phosphoglycerate kinase
MNLPKITDLDVAGRRVLLRLDLDTKPDENDLRIKAAKKTLDYLYSQKAKIIIIGHKGRPASADASARQPLSLKPFQ